MIEIKNRNGDVIFRGESATTIRDAIIEGVRRGCSFDCADLSRAFLAGANLIGASLSRVNLGHANLAGANLAGADLTDTSITGANLAGANLVGASLAGADLTRAVLTRANLSGANLSGANLSGANLAGAKGSSLAIAMTRVVPQEGEVIGWKKCRGGVIVKLRIPAEARRSNAFGRKCRAEFVDVLEVFGESPAASQYDSRVTYAAGQRVICHEWDENFQNEFSGGIHFFITREEAEAY